MENQRLKGEGVLAPASPEPVLAGTLLLGACSTFGLPETPGVPASKGQWGRDCWGAWAEWVSPSTSPALVPEPCIHAMSHLHSCAL